MSYVDQTIDATQNLLCALEQDPSLLSDTYFMQQLTRLRLKHKEAVDYLTRNQYIQTLNLETCQTNFQPNYLLQYPCFHHSMQNLAYDKEATTSHGRRQGLPEEARPAHEGESRTRKPVSRQSTVEARERVSQSGRSDEASENGRVKKSSRRETVTGLVRRQSSVERLEQASAAGRRHSETPQNIRSRIGTGKKSLSDFSSKQSSIARSEQSTTSFGRRLSEILEDNLSRSVRGVESGQESSEFRRSDFEEGRRTQNGSFRTEQGYLNDIEPSHELKYFRPLGNGDEPGETSKTQISRGIEDQFDEVTMSFGNGKLVQKAIVVSTDQVIAREVERMKRVKQQRRLQEMKETDVKYVNGHYRKKNGEPEITIGMLSEVIEEADMEEAPNERSRSGSKHRSPPSTSGQTYTLNSRSKSISDLRTGSSRRYGTRQISRGLNIDNLEPKVTIPKPFKFSYRLSTGNTYSKRFLNDLLDRKAREQKETEDAESQVKPFKASPVPPTTYIADNPMIGDSKYAEAIRRKLRANMKNNQNLGMSRMLSKSEGNLSASLVRPVPPSTYIRPVVAEYRRKKSASQRAVNMLVDATSPPDLKLNAIRSNLAFSLRHLKCRRRYSQEQREKESEKFGLLQGRVSPPDFRRLHAEMREKLEHAKERKPTTVPVPFKFSRSRTSWHRECVSSSPPRRRPKTAVPFVSTDLIEDFPVQMTHAAKLRANVNRKKLEEIEQSEEYWIYAKELQEENRIRIAAYLGERKQVQEEIDMKTAEKRRNLIETTKEYEKQLAEMMERVMNRPLIMERQVALAHKHRFERKYKERMEAVEKKRPVKARSASNPPRRPSANSVGTYSVKSQPKEDHYSDAFESENSSDEKPNGKSDNKSTNGSSNQPKSPPGSSGSHSTSSSSKSSKMGPNLIIYPIFLGLFAIQVWALPFQLAFLPGKLGVKSTQILSASNLPPVPQLPTDYAGNDLPHFEKEGRSSIPDRFCDDSDRSTQGANKERAHAKADEIAQEL
ncbi:hypothetical protein WR25_24632 isoform A [Diploscapter pachys]|uniref:Uncharacterized protein n=1 Tax=Diploscapter pachys TaxID=2018661 RepID=A0A2A2JZL2_9BILA|nr:hypothetical protein WR25_24632 isoform A [Diploscapter pachys]